MDIIVVGAGLSGLVTLKELKEKGHQVSCFEQGSDIGGVFAYHNSYDSVELTVSNYFMAYSDFMPYDEPLKFWSRAEYKQYLDNYCNHFGLIPHIHFHYKLNRIHKLPSGRWKVDFLLDDGKIISKECDRVAICTGQFQKPNIPDIKGLDSFQGIVKHSSDYTNASDFEAFRGKNVLFVGMGESAADIVTELSAISKNAVLSINRYHWFSDKSPMNKPIDVLQTRIWHSIPAQRKAETVKNTWRRIKSTSPSRSVQLMAEHILNAGDEPGSVVTKSERIFDAQADGMEVDIGGIKSIKDNSVHFYSGRSQQFDAIMFCTGFKFDLPFLEPYQRFTDIRECYLQCYHPNFGDEIAFIGFARPQQGGVPLISELLARYFAQICSGEKKLPENIKFLAKHDADKWRKEFYETPWVHGLVNGFRFNDQVAELIGCRPKEPSFLLQPKQFLVYWQHHVWPSQYRLYGPGNRSCARENWLKAESTCPQYNGLLLYLKAIKLKYYICKEKMKSSLFKQDRKKWRPIFR